MSERLPVPLIESAFDALGDVIFCVKDSERRYRAVNQAFADRLDVPDKQDLIGKRAEDFFPETLAGIYAAQDRLVLSSARAVRDQLEQITHRDGSMGWFLADKFPLLDDSGAASGLLGISQNLHTPSDSDLEIANLRNVVEHIKTHLDQPLRVEQLARRISLSQDQLDRRMKRVFRLTTRKFIMKCRLEEATRRLVETCEPLAEIALACGFSDQSAFTRQFRAAGNMPPLMYRKQHASGSTRSGD